MSYTNLMLLGTEVSPVQAETAAAVLATYRLPFDFTIIDFGVYITENFVAQATDPVVKLQTATTESGTKTDLVTLTLGSSLTTLKAGDGTKQGQTAISADTDLDNGDIVLCKRSVLPLRVIANKILYINHTTAATGAGGAFAPVVLIRVDGIDTRLATQWVDDS